MTPDLKRAMMAAHDVLQTEGNVLAELLDHKAFEALPHRVEIAVRSEMMRLRSIAQVLNSAVEAD